MKELRIWALAIMPAFLVLSLFALAFSHFAVKTSTEPGTGSPNSASASVSLVASTPALQPRGKDGAAIVAKYGCRACHRVAGQGGAIGPSLDETGRHRSRLPSMSIEAYLRQSILQPNAFVVPGYPAHVMPLDFGQRMTPEELDTLVKYLLSLTDRP